MTINFVVERGGSINLSSITRKAFLIEDFEFDRFVSVMIPVSDDWKNTYKRVTEGMLLQTDEHGNGYFIESGNESWLALRDYKPTGRIITGQEEKVTIIKCLEVKKADMEKEFLEAKKYWNNRNL